MQLRDERWYRRSIESRRTWLEYCLRGVEAASRQMWRSPLWRAREKQTAEEIRSELQHLATEER